MFPRRRYDGVASGASMNKVVSALALVVVGLAALAVAGPALTHLIAELVPLVLVTGIVTVAVLLARSYTRKW